MTTNTTVLPRRAFFARFAAAAVATAATGVATAPAVSTPSKRPPLVGPIAPDQYIAEMHELGWRVYSGTYINSAGEEMHRGVIEYDNHAGREQSEDDYLRLRRLRHATSDSGPDFFDRTSDRLYELGLREELRGSMQVRGFGIHDHTPPERHAAKRLK